MSNKMGRFFGMGVGPGEPGLIAVAAWEQLKQCQVIYVPRAHIMDHSVARRCLPSNEIPDERFCEIEFTMDSDRGVLTEHYSALAEKIASDLVRGFDVAYLTLGDALTYSTFGYTLSALKDRVPGLIYRTYPGITSYCALAAAASFSLGEGKESVLILPCPDHVEGLRSAINNHDCVVLMKIGKRLGNVLALLREMKIAEHCVFGRRIGMVDELLSLNLRDLECSDENGYLSTMLIRKNTLPKRHLGGAS